MPTDINIQLRRMPFGKLQKLNLYLEPPSDKDWKALSSVTGRYDIHQVALIERNGTSRPGTSCTDILIQDLCRLCVTVRELGAYLKKIKNYEALQALDWPNEPVVIKTQPECAIVYEGSSLNLKVEAIGYPPPVYQWYKNNKEIPDEILCELSVHKVSMADDGAYSCKVSNIANEIWSNEVTVRVLRAGNPSMMPQNDNKPVVILQPLSAHVLPGAHHRLHCEAAGSLPLSYKWYRGVEPLMDSNSPTLVFPSFSDENTGHYCCHVSNSHGAVVTQLAELAIDHVEPARNTATDKVALLIGNKDYTTEFHEALQGGGFLQHTIADTKTLGSLLRKDEMGFNVLSLGNLTRNEMIRGIEEYKNLMSEGCYAIFYYAGHGFELNGRHYLLPVDAPGEWKQEDAICVQWILEILWKVRPKMIVMILDMCRVRPIGKANFEDYDFPTDLPKIVFGFATCSQSEAYERLNEENGIYMKHLKKHICRNEKIEDIFHAVTTDVEQDTLSSEYTDRQRPEYVIKGGGYYSLRDPIEADGNRSAERWLEAHKLPAKSIIEKDGIKLEVRFEHSDWLSNSVNIIVGVIDRGAYDNCNVYIAAVTPNDVVMHDDVQHQTMPRSVPGAHRVSEGSRAERTSKMFHLQRLHENVTLRLQLECFRKYERDEIRSTKYQVVTFSLRDFGLAQVFGVNG